jgi:hypothetical protein
MPQTTSCNSWTKEAYNIIAANVSEWKFENRGPVWYQFIGMPLITMTLTCSYTRPLDLIAINASLTYGNTATLQVAVLSPTSKQAMGDKSNLKAQCHQVSKGRDTYRDRSVRLGRTRSGVIIFQILGLYQGLYEQDMVCGTGRPRRERQSHRTP